MEQNANKDKWIEEILSGTENIKRVSASPFLFPKILNRIKNGNNVVNYIPLKKAVIGYVSLMLLAIINMYIIFSPGSSQVNLNTKNVNIESSSEHIPSQVNPYLEILSK